ncbi:MAG: hypothetical protein ACLQBY_18510 [Solirubrobacteraceae bacterium]
MKDLDDPTVSRIVDKMIRAGAGSVRSERRFNQAVRKQHVDRRSQARQAARDKSADADFRRMLAQLWDARGAVAAIDTHLIEERARVANGDPRRIGDQQWIVALRDVRIILKSFGSIWKNVRDLGDPDESCPVCGAPQVGEERHLRAFSTDGSAVEIDADEEIIDADVMSEPRASGANGAVG